MAMRDKAVKSFIVNCGTRLCELSDVSCLSEDEV